MAEIKYNPEDLKDHHAVAAVIKNDKGQILMQNHVKFGFWTIPIGKAKSEQTPEEGIKEEVFEECNLKIKDLKEIAYREMGYQRDGRLVKVFTHIFEVLSYSGVLKNKEPQKHTEQKFINIRDIKNIPYLSDSTLMFLEYLGFKRNARL